MPDNFDTIIVGARCAGASLATHLSRAGQKVLLVDAAMLPSDQPMSTHFIGPMGVEWLDELGVGAEVRRLSPPSRTVRVELAGAAVSFPFQKGRAGHCLRRMHLDRLLQEAAVKAGADLRDRTKVVSLVRENGRVVGVETEGESAGVHRAPLVVGADGRFSKIAELTGAPEYLAYDSPRFGYWAYFAASAAWTRNPEQRGFDMYIGFAEDGVNRFVFQTDSNLLLLGAMPLLAELPAWKGRHEEAYLEALRASPVTSALVENSRREGKIVGFTKAHYYFREPVGPGYALVGDAGLHKDPTPGFGITDALRDARSLARAILAGGEEPLLAYWRQRDRDSLDLFHFAHDMGGVDYLNPLNRLVYERARTSAEVVARLGMQADREISPYAVVPTGTIVRWVVGATLRGRLSVVPSFFAAGRRGVAVKQVSDQRLALIAGRAEHHS
jgi:flavin-dependent dehydrogenase